MTNSPMPHVIERGVVDGRVCGERELLSEDGRRFLFIFMLE
jgi:hypothetical protein